MESNWFWNEHVFLGICLADHTDSCKYLNVSSPSADAFVKSCSSTSSQLSEQYECRKLVISYRSVETFLRRDCVPKGLCSWKDKSQSMNDTPVSNCVYTDERTQKLECIYCCDTPLCNRTSSTPCQFLISLYTFFVFLRQLKSYVFWSASFSSASS